MSIRNVLHSFNNRPVLSFLFWYGIFFSVSIIVRLPHFLSNVFWFDGDEALIGIMAQDMLDGKRFSLYFYGQTYGLSIFETTAVAFWIKLLGVGIWPLRLGALSIFALGISFFRLILKKQGKTEFFAFLFCLAILCFPAWSIWGSLVRGGYVTGFAASSALLYLISLNKSSWKFLTLFTILFTIIFDSHNLFLFPLFPFILMYWKRNEVGWTKALYSIAFATVLYLLLHSTIQLEHFQHQPKLNFNWTEYPQIWQRYFSGFFHSFGNFFILGHLFKIPDWWFYSMVLALLIISVLVIQTICRSEKVNKQLILIWLGCQLAILVFCVLPVEYGPRYLISFFTGFIFLFAYLSKNLFDPAWVRVLSIILVFVFVIGMFVGPKQGRDRYEEDVNCMQSLISLHQEVKKHRIKAVFTTDFFLFWQWNYMYGKDIPANCFIYHHRMDRFLNAADSVYQSNPESTAIAGNFGLYNYLDTIQDFNSSIIQVGKKFYLQPKMKKSFHDLGYLGMGEAYDPKKHQGKK
jgi:hypothetical protein